MNKSSTLENPEVPIETRIFREVIANDDLHAQFLNTLSLLENTGARKISASEHPEATDLMVLKHAAEEHRHAYYLKKQLNKLEGASCPTYASPYLIAPILSRQYLQKLDVQASRYLIQKLGLSREKLRFAAYLLVTYAIELRADNLYPAYQKALTAASSKVTVKSIILEEQGHLEEMICQLKRFSTSWVEHAQQIVEIEQMLYDEWIEHLGQLISKTP